MFAPSLKSKMIGGAVVSSVSKSESHRVKSTRHPANRGSSVFSAKYVASCVMSSGRCCSLLILHCSVSSSICSSIVGGAGSRTGRGGASGGRLGAEELRMFLLAALCCSLPFARALFLRRCHSASMTALVSESSSGSEPDSKLVRSRYGFFNPGFGGARNFLIGNFPPSSIDLGLGPSPLLYILFAFFHSIVVSLS
jgi:hypothetical protein